MKTNTLQQNIPNGWQEKKLLDCLDIPSKITGIKLSEYEKEGEFPVFDQGQDYISGFSSNKDLVVSDVPAILFGDHTRIVKYIKSPFVAGADGTKIFWVKDSFDSTFLYYVVLNQKIPNTGYNRHFKFFKDIKVVLPESKKEQQKIAEILCAVDEDIAKTQELIDTTEKLKRGLMQELFTIGDKKEIKEIAELNPKQINPLNKPNAEFYYVDIASVKENIITGVKMFFGKDAPSRARRVLAYKDIIISTVRPNLRGFAYISKEYDTYLGSTGFCVLRSDDNKVDSKFLYYIIANNNFTDYLVGKTTGSNYPAVNPKDIGEYICAVPSLDKQQKIADILSAIDEKISVNKKLKEKLITLKKGLMQDLLSGRVRVNI